MTAYVAPLSLIGVMALAYGFVVFMLRHVFLSQVAEPLWASARLVATSGDNLLVICDPPAMAARIQGASVLELGAIGRDPNPATAWRHALMKINSTESGATVVTDIDDDVEDLEITYSKLELLEELVNDPSRTIVVLSKNPPAILSDSVRRAQPDSAPDKARWTQMLKAFVVLDWRDAPVVSPVAISVAPSRVSGWRRWIPRIRPAGSDSALRTHEALLSREGQPDRFLRRICDDIRESDAFKSGFLTREQILDEIEERASGYYRRVWESCSDDEKVVLGHVALVGLANAASRRVVRRLLVRRLLTKDPDLRLMNRTFRLFVLSPANRAAVVRLEGMAEPSTWDRLRLPLVILASAAGVFLYTTQRDVFTSTVAMVGGVTTAVPAIVRALSLIAQRQQPTTTAGTRDA